MDTKEKMKKVLDYIIEKDDTGAKAELKKIIQQNEKYLEYKNRLKEYGLDFKTVTVDEKIYEDLENIISGYEKPVQKIIIDEMYKKICQKQN